MRSTTAITAAVLAHAACAGLAWGQATPPSITTITLTTGETLKGTVKSAAADSVILSHPVLGDVKILRTQVTAADPALPDAPPPPPPPPPPPVPPVQPPPHPEKPSLWEALTKEDEKPFLDGWTRRAELGLNATSGNADTFNARAALSLRRQTKVQTTTLDTNYQVGRDNRGESRNRLELRYRQDWAIGESRWTLWASVFAEVDKYQPWEARVVVNAGPSYTFYKDDATTCLARAGLGLVQQVSGVENAMDPEAVVTVELSHRFNEQSNMNASTEVHPNLAEADDVRVISRAAWDHFLDPAKKLLLKLGIEQRYDSTPGTRESSDVSLFVVLGYAF